MSSIEPTTSRAAESKPRRIVPIVLFVSVAAVLGLGATMFRRARAKTNDVALASSPKPVTAIEVKASTFRATRRYVATIEPWLRAKVGPQLVSAYVDTVLFRPGATVKKGEVLATLDCRDAGAAAQAAMMAARALEKKQVAIAKEAERLDKMLAPVDWANCKLFVEYGPGVGTFTEHVLARMAPDATLIAIDTNPDFIRYLDSKFTDSRLLAVNGSAADVQQIIADCGFDHADYILSGLPFSTLPAGVGPKIAEETLRSSALPALSRNIARMVRKAKSNT